MTNEDRIEKLEERRNALDNSFGQGCFHDGMVRNQIANLEIRIAALRADTTPKTAQRLPVPKENS